MVSCACKFLITVRGVQSVYTCDAVNASLQSESTPVARTSDDGKLVRPSLPSSPAAKARLNRPLIGKCLFPVELETQEGTHTLQDKNDKRMSKTAVGLDSDSENDNETFDDRVLSVSKRISGALIDVRESSLGDDGKDASRGEADSSERVDVRSSPGTTGLNEVSTAKEETKAFTSDTEGTDCAGDL